MSPKLIVTAIIYICLGVPALSVLVIHKRPPPRPFRFPPARFIIPGKSLKHTKLPFMHVPTPHAGHFLPRIFHKQLKFVKKGPVHPLLLHKMKKLPRIPFPRSMTFRSRFGKPRRGFYGGKSTRPTRYGRIFVPKTPTFRRQSGYGKQKLDQTGRIRQPFGIGGAILGVQRKWHGSRPGPTHNSRGTVHVPGFPPVNPTRVMVLGQTTGQPNSRGFQGGHFRNDFRTLSDDDIFDDFFDDRFDKGFEIDIKDDDVRDIDTDFKESLTVPNIFDAQSGVNQLRHSGMVQTPEMSNDDFDKRERQNISPSTFGHADDKFDDTKSLSMSNADSGHNPFNIQPGFLQGNTGVNMGGGIGLLQKFDDRGDDMFDDHDKANPLPVNINFNTINPFTNNIDSHGSMQSVLPIESRSEHIDDHKIEADSTSFHEGISQAGNHFVTHKEGNDDDAKTISSDHTRHGIAGNPHDIDGLELLGHSHPNMMATNRFLEDDREHTLHNTHPPTIQALPFNPHSDESMDIKDSAPQEIDEGTLAMLGIDPRTIEAGVFNEQFGMQPSVPGSTLPTHFPQHQPAQMQSGASLNVHDPTSFSTTSFNQPSTIPSDISFISSISQNPSPSLFTPSIPESSSQFSSPTGAINSPMFPDIPMNVDVFQEFGLLNNQDKPSESSVDHSTHAPIHHQGTSQHQFSGAGGQIDDQSIISQIPSLDDLAFEMDQFNAQSK